MMTDQEIKRMGLGVLRVLACKEVREGEPGKTVITVEGAREYLSQFGYGNGFTPCLIPLQLRQMVISGFLTYTEVSGQYLITDLGRSTSRQAWRLSQEAEPGSKMHKAILRTTPIQPSIEATPSAAKPTKSLARQFFG